MKVILVIPAYNEEESLEAVVSKVKAAGYDYIIVNDGSTDSTAHICEVNGFHFLDLKENLGIGGAVQTGHIFAYEHGYDVDIQFDGDGQHDLSCIPNLLEGIAHGADIVVGSRFLEKVDGFQSTFMRRVGIKWLSAIIRLVCGLRSTDPTSGFRACGKRAMALFAQEYPTDYPEPESLVEATKHGLAVEEVPVVMHERQGGASSISPLKSIYYMIKVTLAILLAGSGRKRGAR